MATDRGVHLRPEQDAIIHQYEGGLVGIAAVPGSGKTFTLAHLAARLIGTNRVTRDQEVLIVTLTNSAVNSFRARIARTLADEYGLLTNVGYRVRTLHGLAHDIIRERPALVGLADDFTILEEKVALDIQREIVSQRLSEWRDRLQAYLDPDVDPKAAWRAFERDLPDLVIRFIQRAKDYQLRPNALAQKLSQVSDPSFDLAHFAVEVYGDYERSLAYRGAVDFDDLVCLALEALKQDPDYLQRLRERWPYILEDEAQDSSRLQEEMLVALSGEQNWVRVGDPNQAIFTTFTTANSAYLRRFLDREDVTELPLSVSGRSAEPIVTLANELVRWCVEEHPTPDLRTAFEYQPHAAHGALRGVIRLAPPNDPQPNPPPESSEVIVAYHPHHRFTPEKELQFVVTDSDLGLKQLLEDIDDSSEDQIPPTIAVLVPDNNRGFKLAEALRREKITDYDELLRSTATTRAAVHKLVTVLEYLSRPTELKLFKRVFWDLMEDDKRRAVNDDADLRALISEWFSLRADVENILWPRPDDEGAEEPTIPEKYAWVRRDLDAFLSRIRRWLRLTSLPIEQLVLTISQDIFDEPVDVALAYKIAVMLRGVAANHPNWRISEYVGELKLILRNERRFLGFYDAEGGFEPRPGVVTIATMHAAKGLEWDRVYLLAVNNYDFPSVMPHDQYYGEKWYVRGSRDGFVQHLNLEAELLEQLTALVKGVRGYSEGVATDRARRERAEERLRLLYVGITRAKRELIMSWNMGRNWHRGREFENQPALPLVWLGQFASQEIVEDGV